MQYGLDQDRCNHLLSQGGIYYLLDPIHQLPAKDLSSQGEQNAYKQMVVAKLPGIEMGTNWLMNLGYEFWLI